MGCGRVHLSSNDMQQELSDLAQIEVNKSLNQSLPKRLSVVPENSFHPLFGQTSIWDYSDFLSEENIPVCKYNSYNFTQYSCFDEWEVGIVKQKLEETEKQWDFDNVIIQ